MGRTLFYQIFPHIHIDHGEYSVESCQFRVFRYEFPNSNHMKLTSAALYSTLRGLLIGSESPLWCRDLKRKARLSIVWTFDAFYGFSIWVPQLNHMKPISAALYSTLRGLLIGSSLMPCLEKEGPSKLSIVWTFDAGVWLKRFKGTNNF